MSSDASNQELGRKINERIRRRVPARQGAMISLVCECINCDCEEFIQLSLEQFQYVREGASYFVVLAGHESPDDERIVGGKDSWLVVQKIGEPKDNAEYVETP